MEIPEGIFKAYDIRGTYPDQLNEEFAVPITKSIAKLFLKDFNSQEPFKVVVGRDMRLSSPKIHQAITETFKSLGFEVLDIGLVDTPTVYFAVRHLKANGGVQITASHNPGNYNGIKIVKNSTNGLIKIGQSTGMDQVKEEAINGVDLEEKTGQITEVSNQEIYHSEVETALKIAGNPEFKKFKIVADAANAMAAVYLEAMFEKIPADLIKMNFELDGNFPSHPADPLVEENLADIKQKVIEEKADLGLAPDGDGDRLMFIDETGHLVKPSVITALVAKELLADNPGAKVLFDIRYIYTPQKVIEENGGEPILTRVGHAFISDQMSKVDGIFGGESSGHYFFKEAGYAEFQMPVALMVLKVMSRENKKLSEIAKDLERSQESGEVNFKVKNPQGLMNIIQEKFADGELLDIDGVAISYPNWRFGVRASNTEPLLRLNVEQLSDKVDSSRVSDLIELIEKHKDD